jgi:hypothetical protein
VKRFVIYLLFASSCCVAHIVHAQNLGPCESEVLRDYFLGVDRIIDDAVSGTPHLSITVIPSFSEEWGVRLVGNDVHLVNFDSSFWFESHSVDRSGHGHLDFSSPRIRTSVYHAALSPEVASRVMQIFSDAIANAREGGSMGLDGVTYRFSVRGVGCRQTWSPPPASAEGRLVEIIQLLSKHAKLEKLDAMQRSEESILGSLDAFKHR